MSSSFATGFDAQVKCSTAVQLPSGDYVEALESLPAPGMGQGLHPRLLGVANLGVRAGRTPADIFDDLRRSIPPGARAVADSEIRDAVNKAFDDHEGGRAVEPFPVVLFNRGLRDILIRRGRGVTEDDLVSASISELRDVPAEMHCALVFTRLYAPEDVVFIGQRQDARSVARVGMWEKAWTNHAELGPHIIPNPLTGMEGFTKDGKASMRADNCVKSFRFAVAEFDDLPREDQIAFWAAVDLPIVALVDSGGKSVHAWIRVDCSDARQWDQHVRDELYLRRLIPLGVDPACRNPSRLSRMPGFVRPETGRRQRLLYLQPKGRRVRS